MTGKVVLATGLPIAFELMLAGLLADELEQQLELRFQPLLALESHSLSVEALLRWCHPSLGWVPPEQFIQVAEQHMLMRRLTVWVINQSFRCLRTWQLAALDVHLSLNISAHDLHSDYLVGALTAATQCNLIAPANVTLEVTETLPIHCSQRAVACVNQLQALGFKVALDDFGAGYANMQQLAALPVDRIKLDKSLVQSSAASVKHRHLVRSLVEMVHQLGIEVVAEGVETFSEYGVLEACGADYLQGYFIATPLHVEEVQEWYLEQIERKYLPENEHEISKAES